MVKPGPTVPFRIVPPASAEGPTRAAASATAAIASFINCPSVSWDVNGHYADIPAHGFRHATVKLPFMKDACGSQTYLYVPFASVTFHVVTPVPETLVVLSTPGPVRWKLWMLDRSLTLIV